MTTTTKKAREVLLTDQGPAIVGRHRIECTSVLVACESFTWTMYRTARGEWWEGCGNCDQDSGTKPWFGHVHGGVCFQCGGAGALRIAASETGLNKIIRRRVSSRLGRLNAVERREDQARAAAEQWCVDHPNLASDLARIRSEGFVGKASVLGEMALALTRGPLSVRQAEFATLLLTFRAWEEAHANAAPPERVWLGNVNEKVSVTGTLNVVCLLASQRYDRTDAMLLVLEANVEQPDGTLAVAFVKMTTSAAWASKVNKGQTVTVTGTVTDHLDARYGKQTKIIRPRLEA